MSLKVATLTRRSRQKDLLNLIMSEAKKCNGYALNGRNLKEMSRLLTRKSKRKFSARKIRSILNRVCSNKNGNGRKSGKVVAIPHLQRRNNPCCVS